MPENAQVHCDLDLDFYAVHKNPDIHTDARQSCKGITNPSVLSNNLVTIIHVLKSVQKERRYKYGYRMDTINLEDNVMRVSDSFLVYE